MKRPISIIIVASVLFLPALAQKRQTDREADGLKGAVKTVFVEEAKTRSDSGKMAEYDRKPESEVTYDDAGNHVTRKAYDYTGSLFESVRYSRLNGDKVAIYADVENENTLVVETPGPPRDRDFDDRYTYRFKYKFDRDGNVSEEAWYNSAGSLWLKYVYKVTTARREELVYSADGSLNQKYVYILDGKGSELEMLVYDVAKNSVKSKEAYQYPELDSNGNWIRRMTSEGDKESNFALKPSKITYRKIAYF